MDAITIPGLLLKVNHRKSCHYITFSCFKALLLFQAEPPKTKKTYLVVCALSGVNPQKGKLLLELVYELSGSFRELSGFRGNKQGNAVAVFAWWLPDGRVLPLLLCSDHCESLFQHETIYQRFEGLTDLFLNLGQIERSNRFYFCFHITFFFSSLYWMCVNECLSLKWHLQHTSFLI